MKNKIKNKFEFLIDQDLVLTGEAHIIEEVLKHDKLKIVYDVKELSEKFINIIFTSSKKIKKNYWPKNKIFICSDRELIEGPQFFRCDFLSFSDVEQLINSIFEAEKMISFHQKLKESEKRIENIKAKNEYVTDDELTAFHKDYELILELEIELLKNELVTDWNTIFKQSIKKMHWLSSLSILTTEEVMNDDSVLDDSSLVFKLPLNDYFLLLKIKGNSMGEHSIKIETLINLIIKCIHLIDQNLIRNDDEIDFWKRIFAKIPYPMAVITNLGDLLIYNELFAKIGILPKECLTYKDQESIEVHQQFYVVKKIEFEIFDQKVFYFVFYTTEKINLKTSDQSQGIDDLGIVSSSIAHELNNPLAGILAALSLLSLEEDWDDDSLSELEDMKNGAKRCKELVEIFLGFSRFSPNQKFQTSFKDSLDQAINLLRFRMIESNLRIEMRYFPTLETFSVRLNSSILSMILYLIISELLTAFAHHRLVTQKNVSSLSGEVIELSNQIIIRLDDEFEYEEKLVQSKLIQHLLVFEKLEINFLKKEIRLIYRGNL